MYLQFHISGVSVGGVQFNLRSISRPYKIWKSQVITGPHLCLTREICCFSEAGGNILYWFEDWLIKNTF